ncbi:hypothetical protein DXU93_11725 [Brumimicrobium aurantiacum]|uniref:Uncharacterized protein n=1 Tax=Brumimicrobium aurantiacum TaxID=1737063 RepID=A0A3E1EW56_9FLAO|nr:hypothetical protein DXU93_11725 [Brumimicrobium aurantiacum]
MKRKLVYNRWKLSSDDIKKHQNFDAILNGLKKDPYKNWKKITFWGTVGTTAVALFFLISHF